MRWPLHFQILIPFTVVLAAAIIAVSVLSALLAAHRTRRQFELQLQGIAATLADATFPLTDAVLRQMHGLSGAEFAFVDENGETVAANRPMPHVASINSSVIDDWRDLQLGPPVLIGGERFFHMTLALERRGARQSGLLHIFYPERTWQAARTEAAMPPLFVGGIAIAATSLVALLLAARFTRPIRELQRQVDRIASADYSPMPLPQRDDELRDLALAVNRLAEQLVEMEQAIRRGERLVLLGQVAGGMAHHLRNHVTGARMAIQLHARQCEIDRESLDVALRQLALTEEHVRQLLSNPQTPDSANETGSANFSTNLAARTATVCQTANVIDEVLELVGPSLRHRNVEISLLPQEDGEPLLVQVSPGELRQLLVNLVLNAADAAGTGGKIQIGARPAVQEVVLSVTDTGPGPSEEVVDRLFEPFATNKPEGVGLGLFISRQIAIRYGGRIEWKHGGGETSFEVYLPAVSSERSAERPSDNQEQSANCPH